MTTKVVLGGMYGDEAKGACINKLCTNKDPKDTIVVRFSGSSQCTHQVVTLDHTHSFSNYGSGTFQKIPTYWSKYCPFDPISLVNEYNILKDKLIESPKLYVDFNCPVITPFDIISNRRCSITLEHGSCGSGFSKTIEREEKLFSLKVIDLYYPTIMIEKFRLIKEYYKKINHFDEKEIKQIEKEFVYNCNESIKLVEPTTKNILYNFKDKIYEGSQGLMLDQNIGFFPHVTRSNTDLTNIDEQIDKVILVCRGYQTRHGNGPLSNENIPHKIKQNKYEHNVENEWQGKFRVSILDLDIIEYVTKKLEINNIYKKYKDIELYFTCLEDIKDDLQFTYKNNLYKSNSLKEFLEKIKDICSKFGLKISY